MAAGLATLLLSQAGARLALRRPVLGRRKACLLACTELQKVWQHRQSTESFVSSPRISSNVHRYLPASTHQHHPSPTRASAPGALADASAKNTCALRAACSQEQPLLQVVQAVQEDEGVPAGCSGVLPAARRKGMAAKGRQSPMTRTVRSQKRLLPWPQTSAGGSVWHGWLPGALALR